MKKSTILAAAIAATMSASAMADVTLGGRANVAYLDDEAQSDDAGIVMNSLNTSSRFDIKSSEDLGNGMTAFAHLTTKVNIASDLQGADGHGNFYGWAGVKGDFGQVSAGKLTPARYALAEGYFDYTVGVKSAGGGSKIDNAVMYSNTFGDVKVMAGVSMQGDGEDGTSFGISAPVGPVTLIATMEADTSAMGVGVDQTDLGVVYNDGDLSLGAAIINNDDNGFETDATVLQASYKMNDTKLGVQLTSAEDDSDWDGDSTVLSVRHYMSKNTSVYLESLSDEVFNGENDQLAIGMITFF